MIKGTSAALVVRSLRHRVCTAALVLAAGLAAMVSCPPPASAQQAPPAAPTPSRIAVVNTRRVFNEIQEVKAIQARIEDENKKLNDVSKGKLDALRKMQMDRDQNFKPGTPQYDEMSRALLGERAKYRAWFETEKANLEFTVRKDMRGVFDRIQAATAKLAKRDGYDMVVAETMDKIPDEQLEQLDPVKLQAILLEKRVLYVAERNDLTNYVVLMLDAEWKAAARAPAAAAGGK